MQIYPWGDCLQCHPLFIITVQIYPWGDCHGETVPPTVHYPCAKGLCEAYPWGNCLQCHHCSLSLCKCHPLFIITVQCAKLTHGENVSSTTHCSLSLCNEDCANLPMGRLSPVPPTVHCHCRPRGLCEAYPRGDCLQCHPLFIVTVQEDCANLPTGRLSPMPPTVHCHCARGLCKHTHWETVSNATHSSLSLCNEESVKLTRGETVSSTTHCSLSLPSKRTV